MPASNLIVPSKDRLIALKAKIDRLSILDQREQCQDSLRYFVEAAWPHVDPSPFMAAWPLDAVCDHLEAVMLGHIPRLLINLPPRASKTTIISIMFPAWIWLRFGEDLKGPLSGPQVRFLCASYSDKLTMLSSNSFRRLVEGEWYQTMNPKLQFRKDQNTKSHMDNTFDGSRQSTSIGGGLLGLGGDILIGDDLNNTETEKVIETGADRLKAIGFWNEMRSTRRNDPRDGYSAVINVQQRVHAEDVSGSWLDNEDDVVHLMIPMRHDPSRHNVTVVLPQYVDQSQPWEDPRDAEGEELMWPERFGETQVRLLEKALGPYMAAGRLQQSPNPKGGGILKREWWMPWDEIEASRFGLGVNEERKLEFPDMELVVASLDTAYKEKEENDFNALTVWGIFLDMARNRRTMLLHAWMKRVPLNGRVISALPGELPVQFKQRQQDNWGLVDWVADSCKRYKVKRLLIEDKARGHDVANEIKRLYTRENFGVQLINPVGDKISRAHSVVPLFTDDAVYSCYNIHTNTWFKWADQVITQLERFPKDAHDDFVDSVSQYLLWARESGLLIRADEHSALIEDAATYQHKTSTISEQYGVG
jgi:predicted phage terminase large subunit-like protein